jgi:spore germination protein PC
MYDWNNYMYQVNQMLQQQNERIRALEQRVFDLEQQEQGNSSPTIDKIEYHFDQLKIERLDRTLHIGLSPNELANIDDLGIPTLKQAQVPTAPQAQVPTIKNTQLVPQLHHFVNEHAPKMVEGLSEKYRKPIDKKMEGDIIHDILGQIPDRISFYEKEALKKHQIAHPQQLENYISDQIKQEVYHSLERFVENMENPKGGNRNEF